MVKRQGYFKASKMFLIQGTNRIGIVAIFFLGTLFADQFSSSMVVTGDQVNLRFEPSQGGTVLRQLSRNMVVRRINCSPVPALINGLRSSWMCVGIAETQGWIFGAYIRELQKPNYEKFGIRVNSGCLEFPAEGVPIDFPGGIIESNEGEFQFAPEHHYFYLSTGLGASDQSGSWSISNGTISVSFLWDGGLAVCLDGAQEGSFGSGGGKRLTKMPNVNAFESSMGKLVK